jgi:hypothetical protein
MAKKAYTLKANVQTGETAVGGKLIRLEGDAVYETGDPIEQRQLDAWDAVKEADNPKSGGKTS